MKRTLLVLLGALLFGWTALAQVESQETLAAYIHENVYRAGINTCPYEYLPVAETPVPKGYKPFYISHYGRHGSRSNWDDGGYAHTLEQYRLAHEAGLLTEAGERAYSIVGDILKLHNGMDGRLTARGAREHRAIAERMYKKYPEVFKKGSRRVEAVSSTVPRCIVSMAAFTGQLLSMDPGLAMSWDTGERFMDYCSSVDPKDVKKEAYVLIEKHAETIDCDTLAFQKRIFKDPDAARAIVGSGVDMLEGTLDVAVITRSFDYDDFLLNLVGEDVLLFYSQNISLNLFLRQCNSKEFGDRRMAVPEVVNLVQDVMDKADAAIETGSVAANLRFGHDYQLLAFCSKIGVKGIGERLSADEAIYWPGWYYTPFAGNIQMIFYRNKSNDVLVKFYINERETTLLTLPGGPYYRWEDVKEAFKKSL